MKRVCAVIALACWTFLFIVAARGYMQIDTIDYCLATGLLAIESLFRIIE